MGPRLHRRAQRQHTVLQCLLNGELADFADPAPVGAALVRQADKTGADGRIQAPHPGEIVQALDALAEMTLPLFAAGAPGQCGGAIL